MERWARAADGVLGGAGGGGALARAPPRAPLGAPSLQLERMPPSFSLLTAALHRAARALLRHAAARAGALPALRHAAPARG